MEGHIKGGCAENCGGTYPNQALDFCGGMKNGKILVGYVGDSDLFFFKKTIQMALP